MRGGEGTIEAVGWRRYDGEVHRACRTGGRPGAADLPDAEAERCKVTN